MQMLKNSIVLSAVYFDFSGIETHCIRSQWGNSIVLSAVYFDFLESGRAAYADVEATQAFYWPYISFFEIEARYMYMQMLKKLNRFCRPYISIFPGNEARCLCSF